VIAALVMRWKPIVAALVMLCVAIWGAVTWADDKLRKVEQVPGIAQTQGEHGQRIRDLENDATRHAQAVEAIQQEIKASNLARSQDSADQTELMRQILMEVRRAR
jgi:hypothetical protein